VIRRAFHITYKAARRIVIGVVGATVVLIGVIMLVTPGPALIVIPVGLAILSLEFTWARHWLKRLRESISNHSSNNRKARAEGHRERVSPD
jgi:tellurite resistance protein TerC